MIPLLLLALALQVSGTRAAERTSQDIAAPNAGEMSDQQQNEASGQVHVLDQFIITLPVGWYVHDQNATIGRPGPHGVVVFSLFDLGNRGPIDEEAKNTFTKVASGEIPSFFVDRWPAPKGMTCHGVLSKKLRKKLLDDYQTSARGQVASTVVTTPEAESVAVGGCQGLRVTLSRSAPGESPWNFLIYAVSDGQTAYDFTLRNKKEFFESNLPVFEKAMSTLMLVAR